MSTRAVLTDSGREWWARFMANYPTWRALGTPYELFSYAKWGEGGWETVSGVDVPEDPSLYTANTDINILENPGNYPGFAYYTGLAGTGSPTPGLQIDLVSEILYIGAASEHFQVTARIETGEENDNGLAGNPRLFEVGIFDNALASGLAASDNLIIYATFDGFLKTVSRAADVDCQIPMQP